MQSKRIGYIDAMRGLTMILVVYSHITFQCLGNVDIAFNDFFMRFRMPLFFFISGWVFFKAERIWEGKTIQSVLRKKFMVQIIPFSIFFLLFLYVHDSIDVKYLGSEKHGYWFTFVLFEFFVLYVLLAFFFQRKAGNKKGDWKMFVSILFISIISFYYSANYSRYEYELGYVKVFLGFFSFVKLWYFIFFWFGTFVRKYFDCFVSFTENQHFMAVVIVLFVFVTVFPEVYSMNGFEYIAYLFTGICGIIMLFTFFRRRADLFSQDTRIGFSLQYIGRRTLDIYLLHYFFLPYHLKWLGDILHVYENNIMGALLAFSLALVVIAISLFVSEMLRLSPFLAHYLFGAKR